MLHVFVSFTYFCLWTSCLRRASQRAAGCEPDQEEKQEWRRPPLQTAGIFLVKPRNTDIKLNADVYIYQKPYRYRNKTSINTPTLAWGVCRTYVANEVNQQVHVDLIRVHVLQHLPSPAAEVVQFWTKVPAGGVPHYHLLEQTQDGFTHTVMFSMRLYFLSNGQKTISKSSQIYKIEDALKSRRSQSAS